MHPVGSGHIYYVIDQIVCMQPVKFRVSVQSDRDVTARDYMRFRSL